MNSGCRVWLLVFLSIKTINVLFVANFLWWNWQGDYYVSVYLYSLQRKSRRCQWSTITILVFGFVIFVKRQLYNPSVHVKPRNKEKIKILAFQKLNFELFIKYMIWTLMIKPILLRWQINVLFHCLSIHVAHTYLFFPMD